MNMKTETIELATKRQLWYLHCLTKKNTRYLRISKLEAHKRIVELTQPRQLERDRQFTEAEIIESNKHEMRLGLQDYLNSEPVANFRAYDTPLTNIVDKYGQVPEAIMVQQASKLIGHKVSKENINKNYRVPVEYCLDQIQESFGGRFKTEDNLIHEIENVAKAKIQLRTMK